MRRDSCPSPERSEVLSSPLATALRGTESPHLLPSLAQPVRCGGQSQLGDTPGWLSLTLRTWGILLGVSGALKAGGHSLGARVLSGSACLLLLRMSVLTCLCRTPHPACLHPGCRPGLLLSQAAEQLHVEAALTQEPCLVRAPAALYAVFHGAAAPPKVLPSKSQALWVHCASGQG